MSQGPCYHCGQSIPDDVHLEVRIDDTARAMCCMGCQAVASAIVADGLGDYYRTRDALPEAPREPVPDILDDLALFDHADFQKSFVRALSEHEKEASLILEGITCAACIWLNEQHISRLPGVFAVDVNYTTRRARVRWDEKRIHLSAILAAIANIGYRAYPYDPARTEELARKEKRAALWRVWVAGFGMMQVMMYAIPVYMADGDMTADIESLMRWASLLLTLPVVFYSAAPFFRNAWRDLRFGRVGMDVPVALGVGGAFLASVWATLVSAGEVYFDSVTMFVFFLLGGRFLEMNARQRAVGVTETLVKLLPAFAEKLPAFPGDRTPVKVVVADLVPGDVVLVRPGGAIPADGVVVEGAGSVNESLLTGESLPVPKKLGDGVTGGAVNIESPLAIRVDRVGDGTRLSAIVRLMERASMEKPRIVELADRVASRFVSTLLLVAAVVALVWWQIDSDKALWITVSVLVVTCPCALSLATPIALTVASGVLAREGLLVTRGHAIETLARTTHFVFDKTGTLTSGRMRLLDTLLLGKLDADAALAMACALEGGSEHPLGQAFRSAAPVISSGVAAFGDSLRNVPGSGVMANSGGEDWRIGRPDFVAELVGYPLPEKAHGFAERGDTVVALGGSQGWVALFALGDDIRPDAPSLVASLLATGRQVILLSGDTPSAAARVAQVLGIDQVHGGISPQGKHDFVSRLQGDGAVVAMVGDGINDAPVLAQAQVSIAMGGGAQLARTQADLVLLSENLQHLQRGILLAERGLRIIRQNLVWSFAYNFVALPLAMLGYVTPWMAGIGMSGSSLLVVLNSLRLQRRP